MPFIRSLLTKLFLLLCVVRQSTAQDGSYNVTVVEMVKDINSVSDHSFPAYLTPFNGELYFVANDGTNGGELWKTDGTEAGTVMVKDINPGSDHSYPSYLTPFNGELYFRANDASNGYELWKTDGTEKRFPWTTCVAGEKVTVNGSATANRQCDACVSSYNNATNQQSCTLWTTCVAGEKVTVNESATADRQCGACVSSYNNATNQQSCTPWTTCQAGEKVTVNGSATANRQCGACGAQTFTSTTNQQSCTPWTTCVAGEKVTVHGSATADRQCGGDTTTASPSRPTTIVEDQLASAGRSFPGIFAFLCFGLVFLQ